jgi:hypothetical protein
VIRLSLSVCALGCVLALDILNNGRTRLSDYSLLTKFVYIEAMAN